MILESIDIKVRLFFAIGFFSGMRTGEITGLKYTDIDIKNKTIKVQRTVNKGMETTPKTKSSIREIDILDVLIPYLKKHLDSHPNNDYLFQTINNTPYYSANYFSDKYWKPILLKLHIQYRNLYQMRHTFASMMINSGEDILWVSNMLGHKNSSITLQVYAKYIKNDKKVRGNFLLN